LPGGGAHHPAGRAALCRTHRLATQAGRPRLSLRCLQLTGVPAIHGAQLRRTRIELSSQFTEIERPKEKFNFTYLPEEVETMFREALVCYSHGALNAFAAMCRRTTQTAFANLGEVGRLRVFDELNELRDMAEIDAASFALIKRVIFGTDADPAPSLPGLDDDQCGLLLEVMKDLLYQSYVRKGRLQQAMMVRRFFSDEAERNARPGERAREPADRSQLEH